MFIDDTSGINGTETYARNITILYCSFLVMILGNGIYVCVCGGLLCEHMSMFSFRSQRAALGIIAWEAFTSFFFF